MYRALKNKLYICFPELFDTLSSVILNQCYLILFFLNFAGAVTVEGVFFCHSVVCLNAIVFIFLFIPETGGKSLHQIVQGLKNM